MQGKRPRVVVFYGGDSPNFDLSSETGRWICQYLPRSTYDVTPVEVTPGGYWKVPLGTLPRSGDVSRTIEMLSQATQALPPVKAVERLLSNRVDSIMSVVRGRGGDDGSMHSFGSLLGVPVVGSPEHTCQITSNKHLFAQAMQDVADVPYGRRIRGNEAWEDAAKMMREQFLPPFFIKPVSSEGSSGIQYIDTAESLEAALRNREDDVILQERRPGTEIAFTLIEDEKGKIRALPPVIVQPQKAQFYDALSKRRPGRTSLHTLKHMDEPVVAEAEAVARDVYEELGARGIVTIDMMADNDSIDILEANTVPTFSDMTPLKHQLKAAGLHPEKLLDQLIRRSWGN